MTSNKRDLRSKRIDGDPIPESHDGFVEFAQPVNIFFANPGQDHLVYPGDKPEQ